MSIYDLSTNHNESIMETDYEKKYKEALERAKNLIALYPQDAPGYREVFPELAESEDERIRKEIISAILSGRVYDTDLIGAGHIFQLDKEVADKWIAYLEKQKEQNLIMANSPQLKEQKPAESISQLTVQGKGVYKICPRCKERMVRDDSMIYTSMPPQYRYECPKCGESECDTVMYDNPEMEEQKPAELAMQQLKGE